MTDDTRATRYAGRHALRTITTVPRCYDCGRQSVQPGGAVSVRFVQRGTKKIAGYAGLATCGRVWLCPVCNAKVMATRAIEIGAVLTWAVLQGLQVGWGSLTVRHNAFTSLKGMVNMERDAWRHVVSAPWWQKSNATKGIPHQHVDACDDDCGKKLDTIDTGKNGRVGYIRAAELTIGSNGWHPHFHPIVLLRMTPDEAQTYLDRMVDRWVEGVEKAGGEARRQGGQHMKVLRGVQVFDELARYTTKATYDNARSEGGLSKLALEVVWSQSKNSRGRVKGTVSHWTLLAAIEQGMADEAERWMELEAEIEGHRMITWSRGIRQLAGLNDEKDDEEIASEEVGSQEDTVAVITPDGWMTVRDNPAILSLILSVLENGGPGAMVAVLDANGIEWTTFEGMSDVGNTEYQEQWYEATPKGPARPPQQSAESADQDWQPAWYSHRHVPGAEFAR